MNSILALALFRKPATVISEIHFLESSLGSSRNESWKTAKLEDVLIRYYADAVHKVAVSPLATDRTCL